MSKKTKIIVLILILLVVGGLVWWNAKSAGPSSKDTIKIGVITGLTGPAAYWGESTRVGAEVAKSELEKQGYKVDLIYEDYQLDATKAVTAAQKLVNFDKVDVIYSEFNPAAIAVSSFLKDKKVVHIYDAAVTSPLKNSSYTFKTYLDYQAGCREVAKKFKEQGIKKLGVLKINMEAGELCLAGVKEVDNNVLVESYNLGDTNLSTQVAKLKNDQAESVINAAFEGDTLNALKAMSDLKMKAVYGTVADSITENVIKKYSTELIGAQAFAFEAVDPTFITKAKTLAGKELATYYGGAVAYTHIVQVVKSENLCDREISCVVSKMAESVADKTIGFVKFNDRIAELKMVINNYK